MNHLPLAPILIPLLTATLLLYWRCWPPVRQRTIGFASLAAQAAALAALMPQISDGAILTYMLGGWSAPFGIALVVDRLAWLFLALTLVLASAVLIYGAGSADRDSRVFHSVFQFELVGLNGLFLTGDLFNLYVFFEILLLASYILLLHTGGRARTTAALHYTVLNLAGSAAMLGAIALIYSTVGTLNLAHLAERLATLEPARLPVVQAAAMLLLAVFALKSALVPLSFWLPNVYGAALPAVTALFAIMTKVGVYACLRVFGTGFETAPGPWWDVLKLVLATAGVITALVGNLCAIASTRLRQQAAYLLIGSVGLVFAVAAVFTPKAIAASLFYMVHSTLLAGAFFMLSGIIGRQRGETGDWLRSAPQVVQPALLGASFIITGMALAGLPPFSGFAGKVLMLQAVADHPWRWILWTVILASSFLVLVALLRSGSAIFWSTADQRSSGPAAKPSSLTGMAAMVAAAPLMGIFAGPVANYVDSAASQFHNGSLYRAAVLQFTQESARE